MKVLITGGAGFIGQRTGEHLMKQGHQVTIPDNLPPPAHDGPPALPAGMELVECDVRKLEDWVKALKENEIVLHLADHHDYLPSFSKLFHINAVGTAILFELLLEGKTSVRRIVLGSTTAVYGEGKYRCGKDGDVYPLPRRVDVLERGVWDPPCPICGGAVTPMITDESVTRPTSAYGLSKLAQEDLVRLLGDRHGIEWVILRTVPSRERASPFRTRTMARCAYLRSAWRMANRPRCSKTETSCAISSTSRMWRVPTWRPSAGSRPAPTTWPPAGRTR